MMKPTKTEMRHCPRQRKGGQAPRKYQWRQTPVMTSGKGVRQVVSTRGNDGAAGREWSPTEHRHLLNSTRGHTPSRARTSFHSVPASSTPSLAGEVTMNHKGPALAYAKSVVRLVIRIGKGESSSSGERIDQGTSKFSFEK